jgi:CheY-like chemotaxis protein
VKRSGTGAVEDEPAVRDVVADLMQDEGYAVRQASDGLQAIHELQAVRCADAAP